MTSLMEGRVTTIWKGGAGNDTYLFGKGSDNDTISNYSSSVADNDRVVIGAGVSADQIWFQRVGNNLQMTLVETNDTLTVQNWYSGSAYHVDSFELSDGRRLLDSQVDALVSAMAAFSPPSAGQTSITTDSRAALESVLAASWK